MGIFLLGRGSFLQPRKYKGDAVRNGQPSRSLVTAGDAAGRWDAAGGARVGQVTAEGLSRDHPAPRSGWGGGLRWHFPDPSARSRLHFS